MADPEPLESSGSFGIPKWIMRKGTRYEVDDFIVSPPSHEEGGFFHLRYGRTTNQRESTYDRINKELGVTLEVQDGGSVLSKGGVDDTTPAATLDIRRGSLIVQDTNAAADIPQEAEAVKPLLVLPFKFGGSSPAKNETKDLPEGVESEIVPSVQLTKPETGFNDELTEVLEELSLQVSQDLYLSGRKSAQPEKCTIAAELKSPEKSTSGADLKPPEKSTGAIRKISKESLKLNIVEKVKDIPITPCTSAITTPFVTPLTTPQSSPKTQRKLTGVVMEKTSMATASNYFFTGSQLAESSFSQDATFSSLSASSMQQDKQLEEGVKTLKNLDLTQHAIGKKRQKPKPSALREMNFWAPTSM